MIECVIIDDEPLAIKILETFCQKHPELKVKESFTNIESAKKYLDAHDVDVIFLDIQMPGMTGLELLRTLKDPPLCILSTAYREFALEGFELNVVDYLLKPVRYQRFETAVGKVVERLSFTRNSVEAISDNDVLEITMNRKIHRLSLSEIIYIESRRNTVHLFTKSGEYKCTDTLTNMMSKLPASFVRIHRSFLVQRNFISSYNASSVDVGEICLPVGSHYSENLKSV